MATPQARSIRWALKDGRSVRVRPVLPADGDEIRQAFARLSSAARYARFLHHKSQLSDQELHAGLRPQPGVAGAIVATVPAEDGFDIVGGAQYQPEGTEAPGSCEFALTVVDDWQGLGLGHRLLANVIRRARRDGYTTIMAWVLADNRPMLALARRLKFTVQRDAEDRSVVVVRRSLLPRVSAKQQLAAKQTQLIDGI